MFLPTRKSSCWKQSAIPPMNLPNDKKCKTHTSFFVSNVDELYY